MRYKYTRRGQVKTASVMSSIIEYFTDPALLKQTALGMAATYAAMRPGLAYLGNRLSQSKPILKKLKGVAGTSSSAGEALAEGTTRRMLTGAAKPLPVYSAPAYTYKGMGQRLQSFMNRGADVSLAGHNKLQAMLNVKLAPVESLWPSEVARGVGYGVLRQEGASRVAKVQELQAALADLPMLTHGNRTFGYLNSAVNSLVEGKDHLTKAPMYDYGKPASKGSEAFWHMLPTTFWGMTSGAPGSGMEHLLSLRAHGKAGDRISRTLGSVAQGKEATKPSALWAAVGPLSYRRQVEDSAEAVARLKESNPEEVRRLGRALADAMHPTHYLHELGRQLSSQPPPIPAAALSSPRPPPIPAAAFRRAGR